MTDHVYVYVRVSSLPISHVHTYIYRYIYVYGNYYCAQDCLYFEDWAEISGIYIQAIFSSLNSPCLINTNCDPLVTFDPDART